MGSIPVTDEMAPMVAESSILENGGSSLLTEAPKYKRRRVSAVRDFPPGCGPNAPRVNINDNVAIGCSENHKDTEHPVHDHTDIGSKKENSEHAAGDSSENHPSLKCVDKTTCVLQGGENQLIKDGRANDGQLDLTKNSDSDHMDVEIKISPGSSSKMLQVVTEDVIKESSHETQEPSEYLTEVKQEIPTGASNSKKEIESKDSVDVFVTEENTVDEGNSPPYHPIPSTIVWKERTYPPRRRVSAVRDFPAGCGTNLLLNNNCLQVDMPADHRQMTEEKMGSESGKDNARLNMKETRDHIHDDAVLGAEMAEVACGTTAEAPPEPDKDDFREANMQIVAVQPPESPEQQSNEGEKHEQLKQVDDRPIETETSEGKDRKEIIVYRKDKGERKRATIFPGSNTALQAEKTVCPHQKEGLVIVYALTAANNRPWQQERGAGKASSSTSTAKRKRRKTCIIDKPQKLKSVFKEAMEDTEQREEERMNKMRRSVQDPGVVQGEIVIWDEKNSPEDAPQQDRHPSAVQSGGLDVSPPPFGASSSSDRGARNKVRETLRLFQVVLRKLLQEQETKPKEERNGKSRIDLQAAKILKSKGKYINTGTQIVGTVPGVEVGDEFHYRVELMMIGLHRQSQAGIDCAKLDGKVIATSIVASGGYDNDVDNSDMLTFSGQGGNLTGGDKKPEDQKLERGNLGLKNSIDERNLVRVIRGVKETKPSEVEGRPKVTVTYTYDGLYTVERYWQEIGQHGNKVYKFELKRLPDQPELAWKEVKKSKKIKLREGRCIDDISEGKERFPICAINTIDDDKPPPFSYITRMMYPDWCNPLPLQGCHCTNGCTDSSRCPCVVKNGGEIPFNFDGAIVEAKPLVFECGPSCKCPASCHNRVSQHGIRFQLEIFKTRHRGWGVRSLSSIPSGSFICEYIGELLEDKEAEQRTGNDEYLFDIGQEQNDHSLWEGLSGLMPDAPSSSRQVVDVGFTIDAAQYGNVGRFINHSCSPNLYAQNVLYDHDDRRIPHVMLFSAENIPPLQELTYHYNYTIGQVFDKDGNVKVKNCYCGSSDCPGRMY